MEYDDWADRVKRDAQLKKEACELAPIPGQLAIDDEEAEADGEAGE